MVAEKVVNIHYYRDFKRKYVYELIEDNVEGCIQYGVKVRKEEKESCTSNKINNISSDKNKVLRFLNLLSQNCVSPIHLKDVAVEYVDGNTIDF